jgi:hypothetical protein
MYPNPTNNQLNLVANRANGGEVFIQVIDMNGRVVKEEIWMAASGAIRHTVDVTNLTSGAYTIQFRDEFSVATQRFQIVK